MKTRGAKLLTTASVVVLVVTMASIGSASAQLVRSNDCSSFIGPLEEVAGMSIGPQECTILAESSVRSASGDIYGRLEIGISGTIEGYTPKEGTRKEMFTDAPEFALLVKTFHGYSGNHPLQLLQLRQAMDGTLGNALGQKIQFRIVGSIFNGEYRDGIDCF